ncbi:YdeI/OmpD-associated family protein [Pseudarthrobacter sp. fls2-241-R2A-127]|uniref:YdeI/OmpD-associated family protein n=1 Tax=Pseudarthrobacter sp. fls2-241-R2A-127 TaxID=3040303 RepID=UPI0025546510|nr:YdeI/OmpD-associated family protein [Pseudarthrobacter sp. fls2-241-R2A-127]
MKFTATVQLDGATATGIRVPDDVVDALGGGKRIPVRVTINEVEYPSTVATMKGVPKVPVSAEIRKLAGINAGDEVAVDLIRDDAPRSVDVPEDLAASPAAAERFQSLSYSNQRRHVLAVTGARTEGTRARRVAAVLAELG